MRKAVKIAGAVLALSFLPLQLIQPPTPRAVLPGDGPIEDFISVPTYIDTLLRGACYDCHSSVTRWPWYARISPVSWLIANDVQHGRSNLDFSSWSTAPHREPTPEQRLRWICRDIQEGIMPPRLYLLMHSEARLSEADEDSICAWTKNALLQILGYPPRDR